MCSRAANLFTHDRLIKMHILMHESGVSVTLMVIFVFSGPPNVRMGEFSVLGGFLGATKLHTHDTRQAAHFDVQPYGHALIPLFVSGLVI